MKRIAAKACITLMLFAFCAVMLSCAQTAPLPRAQDKAFASGSGIQIGQLSQTQQESLYKLCKAWGYVKYHHPAVIDGTLNWDAELFRVMPGVLEAATGEEANAAIYQWLSRFPFDIPAVSELSAAFLEVQELIGFQSLDTSWIEDTALYGADLCGYFKRLSQVFIAEKENAYAAFAPDMPYVHFDNEQAMPVKTGDDGARLLALFRFWNAYLYYSPNIEITVQDWDTVLWESIPRMLEGEDFKSYVLNISRVMAKTGDGHVMILRHGISYNTYNMYMYYGKYSLPCCFKMIDGQVVVSAAPEDAGAGDLLPGDVLTAIDGTSMEERIRTLSQYAALPEPDKLEQQLSSSLLRTSRNRAEVRVLRNGAPLTLQVKSSGGVWQKKNPSLTGLLENGRVGYIDPSALKEGELQERMAEFANTRGLIVDLRHYPSVFLPYLLGEYITPEPRQFAKLTFPNAAIPGSYYYSDEFTTGAGVMAMMGDDTPYPAYGGKVILLMDEGSVSQSEFTVMALRQSPNAVVVGSPSFGADGNVVQLALPGGLQVIISGLGVYTPEGGQTQRVGLQPDILCRPTIEGLRQGRDELMEKAVELILQGDGI